MSPLWCHYNLKGYSADDTGSSSQQRYQHNVAPSSSWSRELV